MPPIQNVLEPAPKVAKPAASADDGAYLKRLEKLAASGGRGVDLSKMSDGEIRKHLLGR